MQNINAQAAILLASLIRAPRAYIEVQLPLITSNTGVTDFNKLGSQFILDNLTSFRTVKVLDVGSDTLDFQLQDNTAQYTPLNNTSTFGSYFAVGAVDIKYWCFLGLSDNGETTVWPRGVFVSETVKQESTEGTSNLQVNALDQFSLFTGDTYQSFPPKLYGSQTSSYYNPNYALRNPSGDGKTWVSDTLYWMQSTSTFSVFQQDYVPVAVYSSAVSSGATPVPNSGSTAYSINYNSGIITFTTAQTGSPTISVDALPLAMRPELALYHLFVDFGGWNPAFFKFDQTGTAIPLLQIGWDREFIDIAKDLVTLTAPKGQRWRLWMDENGFMCFSEQAPDGPPVATLVDTRDVIKCSPEYSVKSLANVIRADTTLGNNQPITIISFDAFSIDIYSQKPTFDLPQQFLNSCYTMDVGSAAAWLTNMCNSILFEYSRPTVLADVQILPNPALQVGDPITIVESKTGINNRFYIKQITDDIQGEAWTQTLQVQKQVLSQDWNFGLPQNMGLQLSTNPNNFNVQEGLLIDVGFSTHSNPETSVVSNGKPVVDTAYQPFVYLWDGTPLTFYVTVGNIPSGSTAYLWRWFYIAEDVYSDFGVITAQGENLPTTSPIPSGTQPGDLWGATSGFFTLPYDVRANNDTPVARKYWWPILRCSDWLTADGVTGYTTQSSITSLWSNGPGIPSGTNWTAYGNLIAGKNDFFGDVTSGFVGQELWANGTPAANSIGMGSTMKYGVDFGIQVSSGPVFSGIKNKQTPCYFNILAATTAGTMQFKKIPFMLSI